DNKNGGGLVKSVDLVNAKVGDILNYTVVLKNTGNVTANNVVLTDTIPSGTSLVTNSVTVNGVTQTGASPAPPTGINVGFIGPSNATTVTFQVTVTTIPSPNPIPNNSTVKYNFTIDPANPNDGSGSGNSNTVNTTISQATIDNKNGGGLVKSVDKAFADINDTLTYTITLKNTGNVTADNVVFTDTIPSGTSFVTNSVTLNGATQTGASPAPPTGIIVGNIGPGSASTIVFKVTVTTIPSPNPIPNNGTVNYTYTVDPANPDGQNGSGNTNTVTTQVNNANFPSDSGGLIKSVDKAFAKVNDVLNYTITVKNTGNVTANNILFTDTIPSGTTFVNNSFLINGVTQSGGNPNPPTGIAIGSLAPNAIATLTFKVVVNTIPSPNPIPNQGKLAYTYTVDPSLPNGKSGQNLSNTVNTQINQGGLADNNGSLIKSVDKAFAKVGDTLTYTITLNNKGNVTANNIVFKDTIPSGTNFVTDSLSLDGVIQADASPAPPTGFAVGSIAPGSISTIVFKVIVATIPSPNPIPNSGTVNYTFTVDPSKPDGQNASGNTNIVNTQVNQGSIDNGDGGLVKTVDNAFAKVGDTLTYTIRLKNTGNVSVNNVVFTDTIPNDTSFVTNSVTVNGVTESGANPQSGVTIGSINPGSVSTVIFKVTVNTIPSPNPIPNSGTVNFNYTVDPANPNGQSGSGNSNIVNTQVNQGSIDNGNGGLIKSVDKAFAKVVDTLTYTIALKNTGNVSVNNVVLTDTIPIGTTFISNSLTLDGITQSGANPNPPTGFTISTIAPAQVRTIQFKVTVATIPSPNPIPNNSTVKFVYTVNPASPNGQSGNGNSNTVTTQINQSNINVNDGGFIKLVNKAFANIGDTILYTLVLKNTGNVAANNVVLTDTIPNDTSFVTNSAVVNGVNRPGENPAPPTGINVGQILPSQVVTVNFNVSVITTPSPNPIPNSGTVNYNYTVDPANPNGQNSSGNSNIVNTRVNAAIIDFGKGFVKSVNKAFAKVNDILIYTLALTNIGDVAANNVVLTDTIPNGTTFISNSVTINGVTQNGANPSPPNGVNVGSIAPKATTTVTFNVRVITIPNPNPIPNAGSIKYTFTVDPSVPNGASATGNSNIVNTQVNQATIDTTSGLTKSVDKAFASINDVLTYTIVINNSGNVPANNVVFKDTIPNGTTFVTDSVTLNGATLAGSNPGSGVNIGTVNPNSVQTLTFKVTVSTIPSPNPIPNSGTVTYNFTLDPAAPNGESSSGNTNIVTTKINSANINSNGGIVKSVNKAFAKVNDVLTYTIVLKNSGTVAANNVILTDTIPSGTNFVSGSVTQNGVSIAGNPNPPTGINLGTINAGTAQTITFKVTVSTIPSPNPIPNSATVNYVYTEDPSIPNGKANGGSSNIVNTKVNQATIDNTNGGGLVKSVDKAFAKVNDVLNYTITLTNTGNADATNVIFTDTIPNGTTFVTNSVTLDGIAQNGVNPQSGVNVGTITAGGTRTVAFQVIVNTIPNPNPIPNSGTVKFNFTIDPANPNGASGSGNTNLVTTKINQANIDNTNGGGLVKSVDKTFATVGDTLTYTIALKNTGNIDATNVILTDTIPSGTNFINDSVTLNGITQGGSNPSPGFGVAVGTLSPNQVSTVTFNVSVTTVPSVNPIPNNSTVNYNFTVDPSNPNSQNGSGNSNQVTTQINNANLSGATKSVDKAFAAVNEQITYTVVVKNTGNVTANNVIIYDTIPSGTSLIANSIAINGTPQSGANPQNGINVGSIAVGNTVTLTFSVFANTIPNPNPITNSADVAFNYNITPNGITQGSGRTTTNSVTTTINQATLQSSKSTDKTTANIGEVITYTVNISNSGNVAANNVVFTDTIPNGTTFVANSLTVNGSSIAGNPNPPSGANIGSIPASNNSVVQFQVLVTTIPSPNPIVNSATSTYNFTVNPNNPNSNSGSTNTNSVTTNVNNADFSITKAVNTNYAKVGDQLTYTISLNNTGNAVANNVSLTDIIPSGTSYVANSLTIGGVNASAQTFPSSISIGSVNGKAGTIVTFKVTVTTIPSVNPIPNSATINFNYTVNPNNPNGASGSRTSNTVTTQVNQGFLNIAKDVDKTNAIFGDTINYTLTLNNPGNVPVNNVVLTDSIPNGTTFVTGSVTVNGVTQSNLNPASGITIAQIPANSSAIITFAVKVGNAFPIPNPIPNFARANFSYTVNPSTPNGQSGNVTSNTVTTLVNNGGFNPTNGGLNKSVDKLYATVGETLTYTIKLKNTGNVPVNNIILTDTIPNGTSFVQNSVTINGINQPGTDPSPSVGLPLGTINPNASAIVTFKVLVNTIPNPNPIVNKALLNFTYSADPNRVISDSQESNGATTTINNANVQGFTKSVDKAFAKVNDVLTYTLSIINTGNATANNVVITDQIPAGTALVSNSVIVNGVSRPGVNPQTGISLGNIAPGGTSAIVFKVTVTTIPTINPIPNAATANFTFIKDPTQPPVNGVANTNTVFTEINNGNISGKGFTKVVDKAFAQVNDILTYTITAANSGNVAVNNVIVSDTIPNGTVFIPGSVTVNGLATGGDVASGIPLGTILPGQSDVIIFKVRIAQNPIPNPIPNVATATYDFIVDPNSPPSPGTSLTNTVTTKVNNPDFSGNNFVKVVDKTFAGIGETLTYTISLTNKGTAPANNVKITDLIPNGTIFVPNSVTLNGVTQSGVNPQNGVNAGTINANGSAVITFKVTINTLPNPNPIPNTANLNYTYTIDPANPNGASGQGTSNTVTTQISDADVSIIKAVNKGIASVGDILEYSFSITNTGNTDATNVVLTDPIPINSTFITDSVTVNGSSLPGTNPLSGLNLGTIAPGATAVVRFKVSIDFLPSPNPMQNSGSVAFNYIVNPNNPVTQTRTRISNKVSTVVNSAAIDGNNFTKSVDKANAKVGDILVYTINLTNSGNIDANNLVLTDPVPDGTSFVPGSVIVNGVSQPTADITSGLNLGTLSPGNNDVVIFKAKVISVPTTNPIVNTGNLSYSFTPDPALPPINANSKTNKALITIKNADFEKNLIKTVDKAIATINDVLIYTTSITNSGNVAATNVTFTDPIPVGTTLVPGSVTVNGATVGQSPATGIALGTLNPGDQRTIVFKVTVNQIPVINPIPNKSQVDYQFIVDPTQPPASATAFSNQVKTLINDGGLNEFRKAVDKTSVNIGDVLTYTVTAKNTGNIPTTNVLITDAIPAGTSFVSGSVTINGVSDPAQNPANGVSTPDIQPGETVAITFRVKVNSIPAINPIPNFAVVTFSYRPDPNGPLVDGAGQTNTATTQVNSANISGNNLVKSVDLQFADVGDIVTYTTTLKNTGNVAANNVVLTDPIPQGTSFVSGSVSVNGVAQGSANPGSGISIGTIAPNATVTVVFKVKVTAIPAVNPIPNTGTVNYNYTIAQGQTPINATANTNTVTTQINTANISDNGLTKVVDLIQANTNSTLSYTLTLKNTGNVTANNVIFTDPIPNGTSFVPNSLTVNGVVIPGSNPANGVPIGSIAPGGITTIFFQVKVTALPSPNPIPNKGSITYNYNVNPTGPAKNASGTSNTVYTTITTANLSNFVKNVDKANANINDLLTYTMSFTNTGNTTATNVVLTDPIPNGTQFIANSVLINGLASSGSNPQTGISLPDTAPGQTISVSYKVQITQNPTPNPIPNTGTLNFTFIVGGVPVNSTATSNTVFTNVNYSNFKDAVTKSVSSNYADFDDILTYTISLRNTGNVTAINVVLTDPIPQGTTFVTGSVTINGVKNTNANPGAGIAIPAIPANGRSSAQFDVKVNNSIPPNNPIPNTARLDFSYVVDANLPPTNGTVNSNTVFTQLNSGKLAFNKSVDRNIADIGDELVYTITATNTGTVNAQDVIIIDTIPNGTIFKEDSVSINGVSAPDINPEVGVNVNVIPVGGITVITYRVIITSIPVPNPIPNKANGSYNYSVNPQEPNKAVNGITNTVLTQVRNGNISPTDGGFVKAVDKTYAKVGDTVTYTISLKNTGNITVNNVFFSDTLPIGTTFVTNSVTLNGATQTGANPQGGLSLGNIGPSVAETITFKIVVNQIPQINPIPNTGAVTYRYIVDPTSSPKNKSSLTNTVFTQVTGAQIDPNGGLVKAVDKVFADVGDTLNYSILITNTGNVAANSVVFSDTIPQGTTLIPNSITVNGAPVLESLNSGINIPSIPAGSNATVIFSVIVTTIPAINPIPNSGILKYNFIFDPSLPASSASGNTNIVTTQINSANINPNNGSFVKIVDKTSTNVNGIITYTLNVKNTGNVAVTNVIVIDPIPNSTVYVANSLTVDGTASNANPGSGVNLGTIAPNAIKVIKFKVRVTEIPENNVVPNFANIRYSYLVNPNLSPKTVASQSNTVKTNIFYGDLRIGKSVDKTYADKADTLNYTIGLNNIGNTTINNVIVVDTIPTGTTFVNNSVSINGTIINSVNPQSGIQIGSIPPGGTSVVQFKVNINNAVAPNIITPIINNAVSNYNYNVDAQVIFDSRISNDAITNVSFANFNSLDGSFVKAVDKTVGTLGDILTYTINIKNTGNATAQNVLFTDPVPLGTTLVPESFIVNGTTQSINPGSGVPLGNITPLGTATVIFKVNVTSLPSPNPIPNTANLVYSYNVNPELTPVNGNSNTNTVFTQINYGNISGDGLVKSVNPTLAAAGDELLYVVNLTNSGNVTVNNIIFTDTAPQGTTLVPNSVSVNGVIQQGVSPNNGISIGSISPKGTTTVAFKVDVISIPNPNPIPNSANITYNYNVDSNRVIPGSGNSNTVFTKVSSPYIDPANGDFVKSADRSSAQINDTITYTIFVRNRGNLEATNLIVSDSIPIGTTFVPNSVTVGGKPVQNIRIDTGVTIPVLLPNDSITVTFKATVVTIPPNSIVENVANLSYSFTQISGEPTRTNSVVSNKVDVIISSADFTGDGFVKSVDTDIASVGDTITYSFFIKNKGNIPANNVVFVDTTPNGATFRKGSVILNGSADSSADPEKGIFLGTIAQNASQTLSYKAIISTIPSPNPMPNNAILNFSTNTGNFNPTNNTAISNTVFVTVTSPNVVITKSATPDVVKLNDVATYTVKVANLGNIAADNLILRDILPSELEFINGSLTINGAPTTESIINGITLGTLDINDVDTITFKAKAISIPSSGVIENAVTGTFEFRPTPDSAIISKTVISNIAFLKVVDLNVSLTKTVNKDKVNIGDTIKFTVTIVNSGNVDVTNFIFKDELPPELQLVSSSFMYNEKPINVLSLNRGVNIGTIKANSTAIITYEVKVLSSNCGCSIENKAFGQYNYKLSQTTPIESGLTNTSRVTVNVTCPNFKQMSQDGFIEIAPNKPCIEEVNDIQVSVNILSAHVIKTIAGTSDANQTLTGYKAVITGELVGSIEYTALSESQSVHSYSFRKSFSTFIILSSGYQPGRTVDITATVEDVEFELLNPRKIYTNTTFMINAPIV
ncbi:DUF11 domain-containing protein, partial [Clostridium botulinum]|nr:DUF11 domain-containing protein [Clostridium botulinum]